MIQNKSQPKKPKTMDYLTEYSMYLFNQGTNFEAYKMLGAHFMMKNGEYGCQFAVWAPNAKSVFLVGDHNNWDEYASPMKRYDEFGIWVIFIKDFPEYGNYKYSIEPLNGKNRLSKIDPYAFYSEVRPASASKAVSLDYNWSDENYLKKRAKTSPYDKPMSIYEVHIGSWKRNADGSFYTYKQLTELVDYVKSMSYTHIELLPVAEYPFDGSWGYQVSAYYSINSRYGTPQDFMEFIDYAHENGIGVILDWVPGHFPKDGHLLSRFDGTCLYEYEDTRIGEHKTWGTKVFNYKRAEIISFLVSNAMFWFDIYHIDGLRVDAVSSMLYRNFGRNEGEWTPNEKGTNENVEAIEFIKTLNKTVFEHYPNVIMAAEESSAWGGVTKPVHEGGLGFNFKWNMGWMNDILKYVQLDPYFRKHHHNMLTFQMVFAFNENFILPISHDEVVHGKKSLIDKMHGDYWRQFAGLRLFYAYMFSHPGKKLLFMGCDYGQYIEWKFDDSLDWHLLGYEQHEKMHVFFKTLNHFYVNEKCLWQVDYSWNGYRWINSNDSDNSIISYMRMGKAKGSRVLVVCNFTPVVKYGYRIGVPSPGYYHEVINTDSIEFGGSGVCNPDKITARKIPCDGFPYSLEITVPPLGAVYLKKWTKSVAKPEHE